MAPSQYSFAQHATDLFKSYEADRQAPSQQTLYATSNGVPMPRESCPTPLYQEPILTILQIHMRLKYTTLPDLYHDDHTDIVTTASW